MSMNGMKHTIHKWGGGGDISLIYGGFGALNTYLNHNQKMKMFLIFLKK